MGRKLKPIEEHKRRVLVFIEPEIIDTMTIGTCQSISKLAIKKEYKKHLKNQKQ